jgi:hypothetical protein
MQRDNDKVTGTETPIEAVTPEALALLGAGVLAYVRPQDVEGRTIYLIYSADGQQIGGYENLEVALAACRQNDLEPLRVH